jgi:glycine oxidase
MLKEVVIVGAGATGCSIAYHLAKRGISSQVIERDSIAARASGKALAIIPYPGDNVQFEGLPSEAVFSMPYGSFAPFNDIFWEGYVRMPDIALELKENGGIDIGFGELAWTYVATSENEEKTFRELLATLKSRGYPQTWWMDKQDLKNAYPDINPDVRGGMVVPNLQVEPYRYTLGLAQVAEKIGAGFRQGEAVGFKHEGMKVTSITLATGTEVQGDAFVFAMGVWNQQSTEWLGKKIPVMVHQDSCLKLMPAKRLPPIALTGITESGSGRLIMPQPDGTVLLGNPSSVLNLRPDYENTLNEEDRTRMIEGAVDLLPSIAEAKFIEHRGDLLHWGPGPYHWKPALGLVPGWDNAYVAVRMPIGITMSLGVGRCMADIIIGNGKPSFRYQMMMDHLSPARL